MDLYKIIGDLREDLARIDHLIEVLEQMRPGQASAPAPSRRGRKAMSEAEKRAVSLRMKAYWAAKKKQPSE